MPIGQGCEVELTPAMLFRDFRLQEQKKKPCLHGSVQPGPFEPGEAPSVPLLDINLTAFNVSVNE
jgi:hypothetical protein